MTVLLNGHLMQDELAKQISSHWSHSHRAISSPPSSCLPSEEKTPKTVPEQSNLPAKVFSETLSCGIRQVSTSCAKGGRSPK